MTYGKGATISKSGKQKINTKRSSETEIVRADDMLSSALWSKFFIEDLGLTVQHNIMYQDNQASMRLEINGPASSSKRTKHIKRKYFLIADNVARGDIEIRHKPTDKMWIDCHTKPKQGAPWRRDRAMLMNVPVDYPHTMVLRCTYVHLNFQGGVEMVSDPRDGCVLERT